MRRRRNGESIYSTLEGLFDRLGLKCPDPEKKLIGFLKKLDYFDAALYYDYINLLALGNNITLNDFFDKNYIDRHSIMFMEKIYVILKRRIPPIPWLQMSCHGSTEKRTVISSSCQKLFPS